ncbi:hypothetical protein BCV00_17315 [Vibrio breoganii]|uniref:O-antigen polymerase n=1 Tax=Vibrio breoganii TaxID=553239 RepID=UPI000C82E00E|nr:O-antigen polymerase [Vibrio breoganii]PMG02422.1 hypothetical protein BCV00_17315 [Vibrio breoganii]
MFRVYIYIFVYLASIIAFGTVFTVVLTLPQLLLTLLAVSQIRNRHFGLLDINWLILFMYFCIAPVQNIVGQTLPNGPLGYSEFSANTFYLASFIIFVFSLFFHLYLYYSKSYVLERKGSLEYSKFDSDDQKIGIGTSLVIFFVFLVGLTLYVYSQGSIVNILSSRLEKNVEIIDSYEFIYIALTSVSISSMAYCIKKNKIYNRKFVIALFSLSLLLLLIVFNPANTSRYKIIAMWLPVFFIFYHSKYFFKTYYLLMVSAIFLVMPIMSVVSRRGIESVDLIGLIDSGYLGGLTGLDIYDMVLYAVHYCSLMSYEFGFGHYLLGVFFFIVPRSVWTSKPDPFAAEVSEHVVHYSYAGAPNLSMPFFMDGYGDFHLFGVILLGLIYGYIVRKIAAFKNDFGYVFLFIFIAAVPIIIRGPFNGITGLITFQSIFFLIFSMLLKVQFKIKN